jgi:transcription elongation factor Elf1
MEEIEKRFTCPYCLEKISFVLDLSVEGPQTYIEDCEVCCQPIEVTYSVPGGKLGLFRAEKAYG